MGWNNGMGWGGWFGMGILMIVFWGLVIWGIIALVRYVNAPGPKASSQTGIHGATTSSDEILATRFAQGEIDAEEYNSRLAILRSPQGTGASIHHTEVHDKDRTVA